MTRRLTPMDRLVRLAQDYRAAPTGAEAERALALLCSYFTDTLAEHVVRAIAKDVREATKAAT